MQLRALQQSGVTEPGLDKEASEAFANQSSDIVAVQIILLLGLHTSILLLCLHGIVSHAIAHLFGDVLDDSLVFRLHVHELGDDVVELNQQLTVLLLRPIPSESPAILRQDVLEVPQERFLCNQGNGSVILDSIQPTEDQVENADRNQQFGMQLLDHSTEAAAGFIQKLETNLLILGLVLLVTLMRRVVPDFPMRRG